jgi:hypothetical protein
VRILMRAVLYRHKLQCRHWWQKANTDKRNTATGVTAIIAKLVYNKANSQSSSGLKHQSNSLKSNLIRVLLDSGSDGDLWFQEKGTKPRFPYLTRQVPKSWHTSQMGAS